MKVMIVESSDPVDFYDDQLDGTSTLQLLKLFGIRSELRIALDRKQFVRALKRAASEGFDVVHVSCHGNVQGVFLADGTRLKWTEFAELFQKHQVHLRALVMSACCGASSDLGEAFVKHPLRPSIIFGSTDDLYYHDYALAWAILYRIFLKEKVTRDAAQKALAHITAVVSQSFRYRRWDDTEGQYLAYPVRGSKFGVVDTNKIDDPDVI